MKGVTIYHAEQDIISDTHTCINDKWVKARSEGLQGFFGIVNNIKCAIKVLFGKADIVMWENQ